VVFQLQDICAQICDEDIRKAIKDLPKSLLETYERAIHRIMKAGKVQLAEKIFRCVAATKRPLRLEELQEVLAVEPGQTSRRPDRVINDIFGLLPSCGDLVVIDEEYLLVRFAHFTIKQFFLSVSNLPSLENFRFNPLQLDNHLGKVCVTYLNFNDFKTQVAKFQRSVPRLEPSDIIKASLSAGLSRKVADSWPSVGRRCKLGALADYEVLRQLRIEVGFKDIISSTKLQSHFPFLDYAKDFWLDHTLNFTKADTDVWFLWAHLVSAEETQAPLPWTRAEWTSCTERVAEWILKHRHCALLRLILEAHRTELSPECGGYLLVRSAAEGLIRLFSIAIDSGIYLPVDLVKALQEACRGGHIEVIEKLVMTKVDINAAPASTCNRTALQAAAQCGHVEIVGKLLAIGANVNAGPGRGNGRSAIQAAAEHGQMDILKILLSVKANINAPASEEGCTALQAAARNGHSEAVEMLLAANAFVDAAPAPLGGRTALQAAAEGGHVDVVQILLMRNPDINAPPAIHRGRTALSAAAEFGHLEIVILLLNAGVKVNGAISADNGRTEMQAAAGGGHLEVMKTLLHAGARLDTPAAPNYGRTTMQAAAEMGHLKMVKSLLAARVDVNAPPARMQGRTALEAAAGEGHLRIVNKLLAGQANVNASTDPRDRICFELVDSECLPTVGSIRFGP